MNKHPLVQLLDTIQGPCPVARSLESELVVLAVESELIACRLNRSSRQAAKLIDATRSRGALIDLAPRETFLP